MYFPDVREVVLFHSATGKDSIVLLDLLSKRYNRVLCYFMYIIKDSEFENKYIRWAEKKYPNCEFVKIPHFVLSEIVKYGLYGVKKNTKQNLYKLSDLVNEAKTQSGISNVCLGFKKYDSLERRILLNDLGRPYIHEKTGNFYPLAEWSNQQCLSYIRKNKLAKPVMVGNCRTNGFNITGGEFLNWLSNNYPEDAEKVFKNFPLTKAYLYEYQQQIQTK